MKVTNQVKAVAILLCIATIASAQTTNFFIGGTGDWETAANWSTGAVPVPADGVSITGDTFFDPPAVTAISGPLANPFISDLRVGEGANGVGTLNQTGGSLTAGGWAFVGVDGDGMGTYNLSGDASFDVDFAANNGEQEFHVGLSGDGNSSTGLVSIADNASLSFPRGFVGSNSGSTGTINQTGGSVQVDTWLSIARDDNSVGNYNMSGGSLTVDSTGNFLTVGENNGATGTMTVSNDSVINTPNLGVGRFGGGATGLLTLNGGNITLNTGGLVVGIDDEGDFGAATPFMPDDSDGTIEFISDGGISPINASGDVYLNDGSVIGAANLLVDLVTNPIAVADVELISVGGTLSGMFVGLAEGAMVPDSDGRTITYMGGDGNDIWLLGMSTVQLSCADDSHREVIYPPIGWNGAVHTPVVQHEV